MLDDSVIMISPSPKKPHSFIDISDDFQVNTDNRRTDGQTGRIVR